MISHSIPARAGLLGNPSDGYGGRTLALAIDGFDATVTVKEATGLSIGASAQDRFTFDSTSSFSGFIDRYGYGTGDQLLAAGLQTFLNLAESQDWAVPDGLEISYTTRIPRGVGLAGSSALVIGLLRCLLDVCGQSLDERLLPALALSAETGQLGISAGLQDRVVQTYGGLVAMDFGTLATDARTGLVFGSYERLDPSNLPALFLAVSESAAEPSDSYHGVLRPRFESGHSATVAGLHELAGLVPRGIAALRWGGNSFGDLLDRNMDIRAGLAPVSPVQWELIEIARECGLQATFCGSGGAIVGTFETAESLAALEAGLASSGGFVRKIQTFSYSG